MICTADDIQARLCERPFSPMRIVTTTAPTYDVYHPDLVMVGRHFLMVGLPSSENPTQADQITRIALVHIAELRDLPNPMQPTNGQ